MFHHPKCFACILTQFQHIVILFYLNTFLLSSSICFLCLTDMTTSATKMLHFRTFTQATQSKRR